MTLATPNSPKLEHQEMHAYLGSAVRAGGRLCDDATAVLGVLHEHFVKAGQFKRLRINQIKFRETALNHNVSHSSQWHGHCAWKLS